MNRLQILHCPLQSGGARNLTRISKIVGFLLIIGGQSSLQVRGSSFSASVTGNAINNSPTPVSVSNMGSHPAGIGPGGFVSSQGSASSASGIVSSTSQSQCDFPQGGFGSEGSGLNSGASFDLGGLIITGPPGVVNVSFNISLSGTIGAGGSGVNVGGFSSASLGGVLNDFFGGFGFDLGSISADGSGITGQSGVFGGLPFDANGNAIITTPTIAYPIGDPNLSFALDLSTSSFSGSGIAGGPGPANANALASYTAMFSGPVANLPPGYTLNSLDGTIVDNHFVGTPEPSTLLLAAFGLAGLAAWGWQRRKRSH